VRLWILLRVGLAILTANQAVLGFWALMAPQHFYDGFPAPGHPWVALLPPYNEHLVRDVGGLYLALATMLGAAALTLHRTTVMSALLAMLVFTLPHAIFHAGHLQGFPATDALAQTVGFVLQLVITLGLLALAWRRPARPSRAPTPPG
jgi:hypothetical protein